MSRLTGWLCLAALLLERAGAGLLLLPEPWTPTLVQGAAAAGCCRSQLEASLLQLPQALGFGSMLAPAG